MARSWIKNFPSGESEGAREKGEADLVSPGNAAPYFVKAAVTGLYYTNLSSSPCLALPRLGSHAANKGMILINNVIITFSLVDLASLADFLAPPSATLLIIGRS